MAVRYDAILKSAAGARLGVLSGDSLLGFTFSKEVDACGAFTLVVSGVNSLVSSFAEGGQVEFWREDLANGITRYKEAEFLVDDLREYEQDGQGLFQASGAGYNAILARRVVAAYAGSAQAEKTGAAESVLKEYVDEQIVSATVAARQVPGLTVQADAAGGNSVTVYGAWQNLLDVCQTISKVGGGDFAVVGTGAATYEFQWYLGQMGTDRRATVVFATNFGNMENPVWEVRRSDTLNSVLVAGQGEESDRLTAWRFTGAPSGVTRREFFLDARDQSTLAGLNTVGDAKLNESRMSAYFDFNAMQIPSLMYGRDYFLGDLVTARYLTHEEDRKIVRVEVSMTRGSPETLVIGTASIA